ncbi:hypothetical protein, partial [Streptomyces eurythermus]
MPWPAWVPLGLATALAATVLSGPAPAEAAPVASGAVLDPAHGSAGWRSPVYAKGTGGGPEKCPAEAADPDGTVCHRFDLTVSVPDGYWNDNPEGSRGPSPGRSCTSRAGPASTRSGSNSTRSAWN